MTPAPAGLTALCLGASLLPPLLVPSPSPSTAETDEADRACLHLDLDVAGRGEQSWPEDGLSTQVLLPRGRLEVGVGGRHAGARVAVEPVRSGGASSPLGVDGESIVSRYQIAEAWVRWPRLGLRGGTGLVDDPWIWTGNDAWGLRGAGATLGEATGWLDRSDLGAIGSWSAPSGGLSVVGSLTSGEGARTAERNNGKNLTAMAILRPLAWMDPGQAARLELSAMVREGSRGLAAAQDHRLAGRLSSTLGPATLGGEALLARGAGGDPEASPQGVSAWARVALPQDTLAFTRLDHTAEIAGDPDTTALTLRGGVGWRPAPPAVLLVGVEHTRAGPQATPVAGALGLAQTTTAYALLHVRYRATTDLFLLENP